MLGLPGTESPFGIVVRGVRFCASEAVILTGRVIWQRCEKQLLSAGGTRSFSQEDDTEGAQHQVDVDRRGEWTTRIVCGCSCMGVRIEGWMEVEVEVAVAVVV